MKSQREKFGNILMWLRYIQELLLSNLFDENLEKYQPFEKPFGFPKLGTIDKFSLDGIDGFRKAADVFQKNRQLFQAEMVKTNPGFYMNFLSERLFFTILEKYFIEKLGAEVHVKYLNMPGLTKEVDVNNDVVLYDSQIEFDQLCELWDATELFIKAMRVFISDGLRVISFKCFFFKDVITFWSPSFNGDIPYKDQYKSFFRFVLRLNHKDIINAWEENFLSIFLF